MSLCTRYAIPRTDLCKVKRRPTHTLDAYQSGTELHMPSIPEKELTSEMAMATAKSGAESTSTMRGPHSSMTCIASSSQVRLQHLGSIIQLGVQVLGEGGCADGVEGGWEVGWMTGLKGFGVEGGG